MAASLWVRRPRGPERRLVAAPPQPNGKVERSHRIDAEEFYQLLKVVVIDESGLFEDRLKEWEDHYDFTRPHGGLGGQMPDERLCQKAGLPM